MEDPNLPLGPISQGATVSATDGLVGTVVEVVLNSQTGQAQELVVENQNQNKRYNIPVNLIGEQVGTQVVKLNVSVADLLKRGAELEVDSSAGTSSSPELPLSTDLPL